MIRGDRDGSAHPCQVCFREPATHQYRSRVFEVGTSCVYRFRISKNDLDEIKRVTTQVLISCYDA